MNYLYGMNLYQLLDLYHSEQLRLNKSKRKLALRQIRKEINSRLDAIDESGKYERMLLKIK